jgi:hypothetical protein
MIGKKILLLAAAVLLLPSGASAESTLNFFFEGGTLSATNSGFSLAGSVVNIVTGFHGPDIFGPNLGTINFATGPLVQGTPQQALFGPGGNFTILGSGTDGIPSGVLFSGAFDNRSGWSPYILPDGSHHHVLHAELDGTLLGSVVTKVPMLLTVDTQGEVFLSTVQAIHGSILIPFAMPEPGSLVFLGMGILGLAVSAFAKFGTQSLPGGEA